MMCDGTFACPSSHVCINHTHHGQIKEECCYVAFDPVKEEDDPPVPKSYRLPDGTSIQIGG